jgi:cytoskeletal protein RodZ
VLLLGILLVAGLVWLFIAQPWRSAAAPASPRPTASTPTPTASGSATPTPEATTEEPSADPDAQADAGLPSCGNSDVTVEALTDQSSYAADQNPQLSIRLTNVSGVDCTMNVGTTGQSFTITSGADTWWRSTDCQTEPSDMIVTLTAGQSVTSSTPVTWDRTRSSVDTCADVNRAKAPGGGASYHLAVAIGGIPSGASAQFLLN